MAAKVSSYQNGRVIILTGGGAGGHRAVLVSMGNIVRRITMTCRGGQRRGPAGRPPRETTWRDIVAMSRKHHQSPLHSTTKVFTTFYRCTGPMHLPMRLPLLLLPPNAWFYAYGVGSAVEAGAKKEGTSPGPSKVPWWVSNCSGENLAGRGILKLRVRDRAHTESGRERWMSRIQSFALARASLRRPPPDTAGVERAALARQQCRRPEFPLTPSLRSTGQAPRGVSKATHTGTSSRRPARPTTTLSSD